MARTRIPIALALLAATSLGGPVLAQPGPWKNLHVLPKTISKDELRKNMRTISFSLGVRCPFCHEEPDMAKETPKKKVTRQMMQLVAQINTKLTLKPGEQVGCWTCHRGREKPEGMPPLPPPPPRPPGGRPGPPEGSGGPPPGGPEGPPPHGPPPGQTPNPQPAPPAPKP